MVTDNPDKRAIETADAEAYAKEAGSALFRNLRQNRNQRQGIIYRNREEAASRPSRAS